MGTRCFVYIAIEQINVQHHAMISWLEQSPSWILFLFSNPVLFVARFVRWIAMSSRTPFHVAVFRSYRAALITSDSCPTRLRWFVPMSLFHVLSAWQLFGAHCISKAIAHLFDARKRFGSMFVFQPVALHRLQLNRVPIFIMRRYFHRSVPDCWLQCYWTLIRKDVETCRAKRGSLWHAFQNGGHSIRYDRSGSHIQWL